MFTKKKYTQNDLRRLMQEQKTKAKPSTINPSAEKIDSPLAKYENGQLRCSLCKSIVRSESVWKVHINTKVHKENITAAKELKERLQNNKHSLLGLKRSSSNISNTTEPIIPEKKIKSILRKSDVTSKEATDGIPKDFFDSKKGFFEATLNKTTIKTELLNIGKRAEAPVIAGSDKKMEVDEKDEALPEGFFDDPIKDAKIRNLEYKDPQEEEWQRFQREIKEEATMSNAIIAGEQEEATTERQIKEIDEQIRKWSKVLDMEKKKDVISVKVKERPSKMEEDSESCESGSEDVEINEFLDWRSKRFTK